MYQAGTHKENVLFGKAYQYELLPRSSIILVHASQLSNI